MDTKMAIDNAIGFLAEMARQEKFDQWVSYLLESIEAKISKDALYDTWAVLKDRMEAGTW